MRSGRPKKGKKVVLVKVYSTNMCIHSKYESSKLRRDLFCLCQTHAGPRMGQKGKTVKLALNAWSELGEVVMSANSAQNVVLYRRRISTS